MSPCPMWHIAYLGPTDWTEPNISICWPTAWREMNCSILKSPEGQSAVEILCTFQWGPSHLHCLFSSFGRQLHFETKSPKLSKMWLPPLNFTQADQRQLLQDGTCPNLPEHLSCASKRAALTQVFHPKSLFICRLPMQPWTTTDITHLLTSPWGYLRPSTVPGYHTRRDPEQKLWGYQLSEASHAFTFIYKSLSAV